MKIASIANPNHKLPDDVALIFRKVHDEAMETIARQGKIAQLARPTAKERKLLEEIRNASAVDIDTSQKLRDARVGRTERIREALIGNVAKLTHFHHWDSEPPPPPPADPTFWWAKTDVQYTSRGAHINQPGSSASGSGATFHHFFADDGLRFTGYVNTYDGDLHFDRFGAVALFELQGNRIPHSPSGRWRSTPHVELFGGLFGLTGDDGIFAADSWSKCWMHRDQQLYQLNFSAEGGIPTIVGQAHETEQLIFEENKGRQVHIDLRGFQWMPPVTFGNINPQGSLWARLEIRFEIQTEGSGSILSLDPDVLLRTFQWPLDAL